MQYFDKTYHPPGTAPGTLTASAETGEFTIRLIDYSAIDYLEKELSTAEECQAYLDKESVTWIHLQGSMQPEILRNLGDTFKLHPLALEDILNKGQRPKVEEYDKLLFIIFSKPYMHNGTALIEQVSIFLGENYIITFHCGDHDPFDPLRQRLRKKGGRIRQQRADYLLYCILDLVIDQGYPVLEGFSENIEIIEEEVLKLTSNQTILTKVHRIRRELQMLKRNLWPQRDALNDLLHGDIELISDNTLFYLRDCYDHTAQIIDLIENYHDMAASLIDVYLSSSNHRLSEIMRVLTMIATIFIPLTFVAGLYGMNFSHPDSPWAMPELHWYFGYPMVWAIMIAIVIGMVTYFKRKKWF